MRWINFKKEQPESGLKVWVLLTTGEKILASNDPISQRFWHNTFWHPFNYRLVKSWKPL